MRKKQRNMFQMKVQDKISERDFNETEISNIPDKVFKVMVIKVLNEFWRRMDDHSENFNKERENIIRKYLTEVKS